METSAKANVNVEDAFLTLASDIKVKMDKKEVCHVFFTFTLQHLVTVASTSSS